jgi:hypothetical protein
VTASTVTPLTLPNPWRVAGEALQASRPKKKLILWATKVAALLFRSTKILLLIFNRISKKMKLRKNKLRNKLQ